MVKKIADWFEYRHAVRLLTVGVLVTMLAVVSLMYYSYFVDYRQPGDFAQAAFLRGDYAGAVDEFTALIEANPSTTEWYIGRGVAYVALENYDEAQRDFETVLELDPDTDDARVLRQLGYIYALDDPQQAIDLLTRLIDSGRARAADYTTRGIAYATLPTPDFEAAFADLQLATTLPQTPTETYYYLGDVQYERGNTADALSHYQQFLDLGGLLTADGQARVAELEATLGTND